MTTAKPIPIPPRTIVSAASVSGSPYTHLLGRKIRIGYYNKQDGLDCIWLVYPSGEYGETTDHDHIYRFFVIEQLVDESDFYGVDSEPLGPISTS